MIISIVSETNYNTYKIDGSFTIKNSDISPNRFLKANFIFYTNTKGSYNTTATLKIGKGIEYIFDVEDKDLISLFDDFIEINYKQSLERVNEVIELLKKENQTDEVKIAIDSFKIVREFIAMCDLYKETKIRFVKGYLINEFRK